MRRIDRLIYGELLGPFINSVVMFLGVLFGTAYLFKMTDLIAKGIPLGVVVKITLLSIPELVTMCLPMSMLLAALLAFGRLSGDSEHVAIFAGGIGFGRAVRPVAWMGLVISILTFAWNEVVVPPTRRAYTELMETAVQQIDATRQIYFTKTREDHSIDRTVVVGGYDPIRKRFLNVTVLKMADDRTGTPAACLFAEWAVAKDPKSDDWEFHNVYTRSLTPDKTGKYVMDSFLDSATTKTLPAHRMGLGLDPQSILENEQQDARLYTFVQLRDRIKRLRANGDVNTAAIEVDLWGKLTFPLACLIFGILGAPLGIRPSRSGKAMGFGIAVSIIFVYWVLYRWLYVVGSEGHIPPPLAAFAPCLIGLVAAWLLVRRTRQ